MADGTHADMVNLTVLDEHSMMENLRARFVNGDVYTTCGHIVVSVNPFRWLPMCMFDENRVVQYHQAEDPFSSHPPHCYSIANRNRSYCHTHTFSKHQPNTYRYRGDCYADA